MNLIWLCIFIFHLSNGGNSARILGIIPTPSYSHQVVFQPLWKELSLRGHQVVVLTTDPINDSSLKNLTEIDLHFSYKYFPTVVDKLKKGFINGIDEYFNGVMDIVEKQILQPQVQQIINNKSEVFDVMLIEFLDPLMFGFTKKFNCPTIGILSMEASWDVQHRIMGSSSHPVLYPEIGVPIPFTGNLNLLHRVYSTLYSKFLPIFFRKRIQNAEERTKKLFGLKEISLEAALKSIELLFTNSNPILYPVRSLPPTIIEIGGGLQLKPPKAMPKDLQSFCDNAKDGFIYFSLGSNAKSKDLSSGMINILLQTFSRLPYKVLWKYENDNLNGKPENVMIKNWLPQQDVLRHQNIKLFISQCGSQSTEEALYSKVPVLGIPMLGDQEYNARIIVTKGWGLALDKNILTIEILESTIFELIKNLKYRNKVIEMEKLVKDQPITALEKAVWWTEYVVRHKGAKHLRSPALDIPSYQYYLLDVIGFCLSIFGIFIFVAFWIVRLSYRILNCLGERVKAKID